MTPKGLLGLLLATTMAPALEAAEQLTAQDCEARVQPQEPMVQPAMALPAAQIDSLAAVGVDKPPKTVRVTEDIIKSQQDERLYRHITLPNALQALLVHEKDLDKASAAMDVNVGSFSDPSDIPGLAHFLEHLLFMGTTKYPDENAYGEYLASHSGHSNAYTAGEHTNYYFEVGAEHLEGALDRFAQFFIAPLFNPSGTDRELQAVDSEHKKNLQNDGWRLSQLEKTLSNPNHPLSHFSTGNLQTLRDDPEARGLDIRSVLIDFYQKHYSANLMRLVVYGRESLDELQRMVVEKFAAIPNNNFSLQEWPEMPLGAEHFGKLIRAKTIKDTRKLEVVWQLPDLQEHILKKPDHYYSHLLGHEGEGSLLSLLKRHGWANALSAGASPNSRGYAFFEVSVELTEEGLLHVEDIILRIFQYLQMLRREGPQAWIWRENQRLEEIAFKFMEKTPPSTFTHFLASELQRYPPQLVLKGPWVSMEYDAELIQNLLNHLTAHNFRAFLSTAQGPDEAKAQPERWYGTLYSQEDLPASLLANLQQPQCHPELHLPPPNEFIPDTLASKQAPAETPIMHPELIAGKPSGSQYRLWFKQDDMFATPKGCFNFVLKTPLPKASPQNQVAAHLFLHLLQDALNEMLYEARLAGLTLAMKLVGNGIEFGLCGYDEKIPLLLREVVTRAKGFTATEDRFHIHRDRYIRSLRNTAHEHPYTLCSYYLHGVQRQSFWWYWERLEALEAIRLDEVNELGRQIFARCKVEALCHGNYHAQDALAMLQSLQDMLGAPSDPAEEEIQGSPIVQLEAGRTRIFRPRPVANVNSAIDVYLQTGSLGDVKLRALTMLFAQVFYEPFFDQLRTKEQLGYVVSHNTMETTATSGLRFLIQSERNPIELDARIEEFIAGTLPVLQKMDEGVFERHRQSLITRLLTKKRSILKETEVYWRQIIDQQYEFERAALDAERLRTITKPELVKFAQDFVVQDGPERRKLAIHIWSEGHPVPADAYAKLSEDGKTTVTEDPRALIADLVKIPPHYTLHLT